MKRLLVISSVAVLAGCAASNPGLPTEAGVDLNRYMGTWYEQARLQNQFQKNCAGDVQADYALQEESVISVTNQCRTKDGMIKVATAEGRLSKVGHPPDSSKLEVRFAPKWTSWLPIVWGDYWIIKLQGDYQYSLVGTPDRKYLWVLSREKQADQTVVNELLEYAKTLDFPVEQMITTAQ